jgi:glycerophosphoryl diester phosphodiesterase
VFAHRGGAKLAPENTIAAFENGMALGSDGVECDVHLARDGAPVVIHDATLDRNDGCPGPVGHRRRANWRPSMRAIASALTAASAPRRGRRADARIAAQAAAGLPAIVG